MIIPEISIIIPTIGRTAIFERTLKSLVASVDDVNAEILIINDSGKFLRTPVKSDKISMFDNPNSGAASARNYGIKKAKSDLLLFLDDDILINKYNIERTIHLHKKHNNSGFNFFWIYPPDLIEKLPKTKYGRYVLKTLKFSNSFRLNYELPTNKSLIKESGLTSQYFSIEKKYITKVGGYDEDIPYAGVEDCILYKKLSNIGISIYLSISDIVFQNEVERISLLNTMARYRRGAFTRRVAYNKGYKNLGVDISHSKKIISYILLPLKSLIYATSIIVNNNYLYSKLVNLLLLLSTYQGYYKDKLTSDFSN